MFYVALKMLIGDRSKFIGIIIGLSFASLIMTQQPGVFVGIMSRSFSVINDMNVVDIWVMDSKVQYIDDNKTIPSTMLYRVNSIEGIKWAKPLYKGLIQARIPNGTFQNCYVIGLDDTTLIGAPPHMISGNLHDLRQSDAIILNHEGAFDKLALPSQTPGRPKTALKIGDTLEINDHRAVIVGIAKTQRTFFSWPIVYTTYTRAISFAPPQRNSLTFILVKAKKGTNINDLKKRITKKTGLVAYTSDEFKDVTVNYLLKNTGIPINFGFSVLLGFLVGAAIAGQTFYNFTLENLRYFGVLKAMGASPKTLLLMILFQSLLVGAIGYGLGMGCTSLFAHFTEGTAVAFKFPWQLFVFSLVGIIIILSICAIISIQRVLKLDPAIVFKS
jgi:putative ABC transport system permease protein